MSFSPINYAKLYLHLNEFNPLFDEINRIDDARRAIATLIGQADDIQTNDCHHLQSLMNFLQDHQDSLTGRLHQIYVQRGGNW